VCREKEDEEGWLGGREGGRTESCLEEGGERVLLAVLLDEHLEVLVDGGDGEQDARARPDGAHEVGDDGERADAHATEGGGGGDITVELLGERRVAVPSFHFCFMENVKLPR